jgi:hypothetical protein
MALRFEMNKNLRGLRKCLAMTAVAVSPAVMALTPISEEQGWSGYLMVGGGYSEITSNTVAGNDLIDGGLDTIQSIDDKAQAAYVSHAIAGTEVAYTLDNRNQLFVGSSLEDQLTMDYGSQVGWRKQTDQGDIFQLGYLFSGMPAEVWEDPYLVGTRRKATDRNTEGARFVWDRIMGTRFEFTAQYRELDLDRERSGSDPTLGCDERCQSLLDRDGDQYQMWLSYTLPLQGGHFLRPQLRYRQDDRDGSANSSDTYAFQLSYSYLSPSWIFIGNALYGESSFDRNNPLYGRKQDAESVVFDATLLYRLPIQGGRWQVFGSVFWGDADSDINFHDTEIEQFFLGVIYNFGQLPGAR